MSDGYAMQRSWKLSDISCKHWHSHFILPDKYNFPQQMQLMKEGKGCLLSKGKLCIVIEKKFGLGPTEEMWGFLHAVAARARAGLRCEPNKCQFRRRTDRMYSIVTEMLCPYPHPRPCRCTRKWRQGFRDDFQIRSEFEAVRCKIKMAERRPRF